MQANHHFALVIGIAAYSHLTPLSSAVIRDAEAVYQLLLNPDYCAYPARNVLVLQDDDATAVNLRNALDWLAQHTQTDSIVTLYYSGHGGRVAEGGQEQTYLLPVDARFIDGSRLDNVISGAELSECLRRIPARKLVVVFDCCHAGGIGQPKSGDQPLLKQGFDEHYYQQLGSGQGRAIVASSLENETSAILFGENHSLFTKHLLAGLQGGILSHDGFVRVFELFNYVQQQVRAEAQQNHLQQSPFFQCALQDNFPVALYRAGRKEAYLPDVAAVDSGGLYDFDVYVSYLLQPADNDDLVWVEDELIPTLIRHNLKVASQRDIAVAGVAQLDSERTGMTRAKRTVVIVSQKSVHNELASFEGLMAQYMGLRESQYRVIPVYREVVDEVQVPLRLGMLSGVNLASRRSEQEMQRLIKALQSPLP